MIPVWMFDCVTLAVVSDSILEGHDVRDSDHCIVNDGRKISARGSCAKLIVCDSEERLRSGGLPTP